MSLPVSSDRLAAVVLARLEVAEPGVADVVAREHGFQISFDDSDFLLDATLLADGGYDARWQVTVREPAPSLMTWWTAWRRSYRDHDTIDALVGDVVEARSRIRRMLSERTAASSLLVQRPPCVSRTDAPDAPGSPGAITG